MLFRTLCPALLVLVLGAAQNPVHAQIRLEDIKSLGESDRQEISLRAIGFLKDSPATDKWVDGFRGAGAEDVLAHLPSLVETHGVSSLRIRALVDSLVTFRTTLPDWACANAGEQQAECALESARFFARVNTPVLHNDTAWVVIALFAKRQATVSRATALIAIVRESAAWRPVKIMWAKE